jgi:hypothetical protein
VGSILHATSLVVRKKNGELDFIFMDPLNWKFSIHQSYKRIIYPIIRLASDFDYAKKTIIRAAYLFLLKAPEIITDQEFRAVQFFLFLPAVEGLDLLKDEFFQNKYKKPLCDLIQNSLSGVFASKEISSFGIEIPSYPDAKSELLRRYSCSP